MLLVVCEKISTSFTHSSTLLSFQVLSGALELLFEIQRLSAAFKACTNHEPCLSQRQINVYKHVCTIWST